MAKVYEAIIIDSATGKIISTGTGSTTSSAASSAASSTTTSSVGSSVESTVSTTAVAQPQVITGNTQTGVASAVNNSAILATAVDGYSKTHDPIIYNNLENYVVTDVSGLIDEYNDTYIKLYNKIETAIDNKDYDFLAKYVFYTTTD
jgi:hypothetical protein